MDINTFFQVEVVIGAVFTIALGLEFFSTRKLNRIALEKLVILDELKEVYLKLTMEKYGVDMSSMPVTDEQIKKLNKMASDLNITYRLPENRNDADKLIEELGKENSDGSNAKV
jgi:hypothetical protein